MTNGSLILQMLTRHATIQLHINMHVVFVIINSAGYFVFEQSFPEGCMGYQTVGGQCCPLTEAAFSGRFSPIQSVSSQRNIGVCRWPENGRSAEGVRQRKDIGKLLQEAYPEVRKPGTSSDMTRRHLVSGSERI